MSGEHEHVPVAAIALRQEQRDGQNVAVYTYQCPCGHTWEEAEAVLGMAE